MAPPMTASRRNKEARKLASSLRWQDVTPNGEDQNSTARIQTRKKPRKTEEMLAFEEAKTADQAPKQSIQAVSKNDHAKKKRYRSPFSHEGPEAPKKDRKRGAARQEASSIAHAIVPAASPAVSSRGTTRNGKDKGKGRGRGRGRGKPNRKTPARSTRAKTVPMYGPDDVMDSNLSVSERSVNDAPMMPMHRRYKVVGPAFGMFNEQVDRTVAPIDSMAGSAADGWEDLGVFTDVAWRVTLEGVAAREKASAGVGRPLTNADLVGSSGSIAGGEGSPNDGHDSHDSMPVNMECDLTNGRSTAGGGSGAGGRSKAEGGSADGGEQSPIWAPKLAILAHAASGLDLSALGGNSAVEGGSADGDESSPVSAKNLPILVNTASTLPQSTAAVSSVEPNWVGLEMIQDVANAQTDPLAFLLMEAEAIEARRDRSQCEWGRRGVEQGGGGWGPEACDEDEYDDL